MTLKILFCKNGHKLNPLLGINYSFKKQIILDKMKFGVSYMYLENPCLIVRLFRYALRKPIYIRRLDPKNVRIGQSSIKFKSI